MYHYKWAIIDPLAKRHQMAFRWRADDGPTLNASLVAVICIARKTYIFVIFQRGGVWTPCPPLDPHNC